MKNERREETPIVLCIVCRTGIGRVEDLALTPSGPTHVGCGATAELTGPR